MIRVRRHLGALLLLGVALALGAGPAQAQGGDRAAAQVLFDEGKQLRKQGEVEQACSKFAESLRLDPAVGTRFNLADCYERVGRLATAWTHFLQVATDTRLAGQQERSATASKRAAALAPRLPKLRLEPTEPPPGMSITLDGTAVGRPAWSTDVPADLGSHRIEAQAPGRQTWRQTIEVEQEGKVLVVEIPALAAGDPEQDMEPEGTGSDGSPAGPDDVTDDGSALGTAGLVIAGVGLAGLAVGTVFGVVAMSNKSDVDELCPDENNCTAEGIELNDEARTAGTVSTIGFIAGGALLVGGVVMWLAAPADDDEPAAQHASVELLPTIDGTGPGLLVHGRF